MNNFFKPVKEIERADPFWNESGRLESIDNIKSSFRSIIKRLDKDDAEFVITAINFMDKNFVMPYAHVYMRWLFARFHKRLKYGRYGEAVRNTPS